MGKQRRQRRHEPPPGPGRRLAERLRRAASVLVVVLAVATALLKVSLMATALLSGVYTSVSRVGGPSLMYREDTDPARYWFWMACDGFFTVLLLLLAATIAWVFLVLDKRR